MSTLQEFAARIAAAADHGSIVPTAWDRDTSDIGGTVSLEDWQAEEGFMRLRSLSCEIRRIAWSYPYRQRARDLAREADATADRIAADRGLMGGSPWPIFEPAHALR